MRKKSEKAGGEQIKKPEQENLWDLFFKIPLLIADRLTNSERFDKAKRWFHQVFDPHDQK